MPNIMPIGMLDISIIMNCLPPRAQFGTVTHFRPSSFAAWITREDDRLGRVWLEQRSALPHRLGVPRLLSSHTGSRLCAGRPSAAAQAVRQFRGYLEHVIGNFGPPW
jgi:hypothetical protein